MKTIDVIKFRSSRIEWREAKKRKAHASVHKYMCATHIISLAQIPLVLHNDGSPISSGFFHHLLYVTICILRIKCVHMLCIYTSILYFPHNANFLCFFLFDSDFFLFLVRFATNSPHWKFIIISSLCVCYTLCEMDVFCCFSIQSFKMEKNV